MGTQVVVRTDNNEMECLLSFFDILFCFNNFFSSSLSVSSNDIEGIIGEAEKSRTAGR